MPFPMFLKRSFYINSGTNISSNYFIWIELYLLFIIAYINTFVLKQLLIVCQDVQQMYLHNIQILYLDIIIIIYVCMYITNFTFS